MLPYFPFTLYYLTLPLCHILQDVGNHGLKLFSTTCDSDELPECHSSACHVHHSIYVFHSLPSSSSVSLNQSNHNQILHPWSPHRMTKKLQLRSPHCPHQLPLSLPSSRALLHLSFWPSKDLHPPLPKPHCIASSSSLQPLIKSNSPHRIEVLTTSEFFSDFSCFYRHFRVRQQVPHIIKCILCYSKILYLITASHFTSVTTLPKYLELSTLSTAWSPQPNFIRVPSVFLDFTKHFVFRTLIASRLF